MATTIKTSPSDEPKRVLIVSDLHLGLGRESDTGRFHRTENFFADFAFRDFLEFHARSGPESQLLVLNGDIFDFIRIGTHPTSAAEFKTWKDELAALGKEIPAEQLKTLSRKERRFGLRTDDYKSVWKLLKIAEGHRVFFESLGAWVKSGGRVIFIKGNHDVELYWPLVQAAVRREIARADPVLPVHDHVLFEQDHLHLRNLYVEHGHRFESVTSVKGPPVLPGSNELTLPLGSFVNRYIVNHLEGLDPFLDNLKPLDRMLWRLIRKHPLKIFVLLWRSIPFLRRAFRPYWARDTLAFLIYFASLLIPVLTIGLVVAALAFTEVSEFLRSIFGRFRGVASVLGVSWPYVAGAIRDVRRKLKRRPDVGEDHFAEAIHKAIAKQRYDTDYSTLYGVLGHTHVPDVQSLPRLHGAPVTYLNSGTWIGNWSEDRPDLSGRTIHSFLRFDLNDDGGYEHQHETWLAEAQRPVRSAIVKTEQDQKSAIRKRRYFSRREFRTLEKFAEVAIEGQDEVLTPREVAFNIDSHFANIKSKRKKSVKLILFFVEYLLPLRYFRPRFSWMGYRTRKRFIERFTDPSRRNPLRDLARVRVLFLAGYYGDPRVYDSINFVPVADRPKYQPDKLKERGLKPVPLFDPTSSTVETDICVIGSGAGGAIVAYHAAKKNDVVLLEEGPYLRGMGQMSHDEREMTAILYKDSGLQTSVDLHLGIQQGRCLGGSTFINNAICFRLDDPYLSPPRPRDEGVLKRWEILGAKIVANRLSESYDRVGHMIGVKPLLETQEAGIPDIDGGNSDALMRGWKALVAAGEVDAGIKYGHFRKNYCRCLGCGYCVLGCRYERKLSMAETYIPAATTPGETGMAGARVVVGCRARRIVTSGRSATEVRCLMSDGRKITVRAKKVVVSCGAIGSSVLLQDSGIRKNVGSRFSFNANTPMIARFPKGMEVNGYDGVMMPSFVDAREYILEAFFSPPLAFSALVPGWFTSHFNRMKDYDRYAGAGVVIGTDFNARVKRFRLFRDMVGPVAYKMTDADMGKLRHGMAQLARIYFAAGAEVVHPTSFLLDLEMKADDYKRKEDIDRFIRDNIKEPAEVNLNSAHPQGGNPMSDDPRIGVVNSQFRVHGFDNLYVCDASVFPTTIGINPQWTVMAMADYFCHLDVL